MIFFFTSEEEEYRNRMSSNVLTTRIIILFTVLLIATINFVRSNIVIIINYDFTCMFFSKFRYFISTGIMPTTNDIF